MKKKIEIGEASPRPWRIEHVTRQREAVIKAADNAVVAVCNADNAELIIKAANNDSDFAAPELYECLREAVTESCHDCEDTNIEHCRNRCPVAKWRDALAKASGESEVAK